MPIEKSGTCVFVGCARNCGAFLHSVFRNIEALSAAFEQIAVVVCESDSDDDTALLLEGFAARRQNVHVISKGRLATQTPRKTERLAICRNACLEFVRTSRYATYDYLVVLDFDDVNAGIINVESFVAARQFLRSEPQAIAVFANPQPIYYDIWALRHETWCPTDCWQEVRASGDADARQTYVDARMIPVPPQGEPIGVRSAFGGLGLYRLEAAVRGAYIGVDADGFETCEHVSFHDSLREQTGGGFFIFPGLTNRTAWEHVLPRSAGRLRHLRLLTDEGSCELLAPDEHKLDVYRGQHPLYDRRLPMLARIMSLRHPATVIVDVGANIGDTAALCRLAGCELGIVSVEASLFYFKLFQSNVGALPDLFRNVEAHWAFVGRPDDQTELVLHDGTASLVARQGPAAKTAFDRAPVKSLSTLVRGTPSLVKTDTDGYDHAVLEHEFAFLERSKPVIWCEAESLTQGDDERWRNLISRLVPGWPHVMAFDNFGFCLLSGTTAEHASACADLIGAGRRYRSAQQAKVGGEPRIYYVDLVFFPPHYEPVWREFAGTIGELQL